VIVLFDKNWQGGASTDVIAAFKPDIVAGKTEDVSARSIRIYREE
jgi:hypothetical protein